MNITYEQGPNPKQRAPGRKRRKSKHQARVVITLNVEVEDVRPPMFDAVDVLRPIVDEWHRSGQEEELIDHLLNVPGVLIDSASFEVTK